jgi:prepilin-type N-terminal cleavage/methylation domain-containing protein
MKTNRIGAKRGFTLVEVVIAMAVLSVVALAAMTAFQVLGQNSVRSSSASFATQKVIQMMEELRAVSESSTVAALDDYSDDLKGADYRNPILTTLKEVTGAVPPNPAHPVSGNPHLHYSRRVVVLPIPGDTSVRRVSVHVYKEPSGEVLAEAVSLLRSSRNASSPSQQFDLYLLAFENVMGYWTKLESLKPTVDAAIDDLERRNPGLKFTRHYITRLAYGRDPYYAPYLNKDHRSDALPIEEVGVYYLPGHIITGIPTKGSPDEYRLYPLEYITGRVNVDGTIQNSAVTAPAAYEYSLSDRYNHAVRLPDERAMYRKHQEKKLDAEPSWRLLLEDLNTAPEKYRNAIFLNLHGSMMPIPAMRNYSDPAKDPGKVDAADLESHPNERAVTHPENLEYPIDPATFTNAAPIRLRVYAYSMTPDAPSPSSTTVSIVLTNIGKTEVNIGDIGMSKAIGGGAAVYTWSRWAGSGTNCVITQPGDEKKTRFILSETSLKNSTTTVGGNTGLPYAHRLYGLEYIPCPVTGNDFTVDLTTDFDGPKNTARWVIEIPAGKLTLGEYVVETVIGDAPKMDALRNDSPDNTSKSNMSRTYFWVVNPLDAATRVPYTERFQYLGDPRYMPYADVKKAAGYNWFFQTYIMDSNGYDGFPFAKDTWLGGENSEVIYDVPRLLGTVRDGLMKSNSFFVHMAGSMATFISLGGDLANQQEGGYKGISVNEFFWTPGVVTPKNIHEVKNKNTSDIYGMKLIASTDEKWFGRYWMGELYPDASYPAWGGVSAIGNLPVGSDTMSDRFYRAGYRTTLEGRQWFDYTDNGSPAPYLSFEYGQGPASFVNGSETPTDDKYRLSATSFMDGSRNLTLSDEGKRISIDFGTVLYDLTSTAPLIKTNENVSGTPAKANVPVERNTAVYKSSRTTVSLSESYYTESTNLGSSYIRVHQDVARGGKGDKETAHLVLNQLSPTNTGIGSSYVGAMSLATGVRAFMTAGLFKATDGSRPVLQLPYVAISTPAAYNDIRLSSATTTELSWQVSWSRWDSLSVSSPTAYTEKFTSPYTPDPDLVYIVKVANGKGENWRFVKKDGAIGDSTARGEYKDAERMTITSLKLNVGALGPGTHIVRVEAFRRRILPDGATSYLHYAYHERNIYVFP